MIGRILLFGVLASFGGPARPQDATLNSIREIGPAILACWKPPIGTEGMEATIRFSVKRTGEILGQPRVTYSKLHGPASLQRAFAGSIGDALRECTPLRLSSGLGGAIAGRPISIRLVHPNARLGV